MPWQDMAGQGRHGYAYDLNKDDEPAPAVEASVLVRVAFHYSFSKASYQIWASESFPYASPATESA